MFTVSTENYDLDALLAGESLLTFPEVAEQLGVPVTKVHDYVNAGKLLSWKKEGKKVVPSTLLGEDGGLSKFISGAITVLLDGGFTQDEILGYLFTADESLPGRPIDALHGHGAREVIRRAQAMAF
ncbi:DNA-binding protein [Corynebacterium tuscaniense]|uniref:DNA-binding protein n=1 Tax=Corynebacterium tuscaniense TaxID=302449 RepID=A0A2N6T5B5_9CORY|nr:Rv2175c family DNA-binding protein [Corynebacterium tuscaniense]PMC64501.1 DNA-binding protein [Corynebacterium tuscaniense]